jgi:hypothetical protein
MWEQAVSTHAPPIYEREQEFPTPTYLARVLPIYENRTLARAHLVIKGKVLRYIGAGECVPTPFNYLGESGLADDPPWETNEVGGLEFVSAN